MLVKRQRNPGRVQTAMRDGNGILQPLAFSLSPQGSPSGLTLTEVLIALAVMVLGVLAVVALIPLGVLRTRQAVLDTRTSLLAIAADATVKMHEWQDDGRSDAIRSGSFLWYPPTKPLQVNPGAYPADSSSNVFANVIGPNGVFIAMSRLATPGAAPYPVLIDPVAVNSLEFQTTDLAPTDPAPNNFVPADVLPFYKRVAIAADLEAPAGSARYYLTMPPFEGNTRMFDLPVYSLSDVQLLPVEDPNLVGNYIRRREAYLQKWFFSPDDLRVEADNTVLPADPRRLATPPPLLSEYLQSYMLPFSPDQNGLDLGNTGRATAARNPEYSWAFVILDKGLQLDASATWLEPVSLTGRLLAMTFYHRNVADPYRSARACFFNGSATVTVSWPNTVQDPGGAVVAFPRPEIKRGTWLMEATLTVDDPANANDVARRAIAFHRVVAFQDPVLIQNGGMQEWHQVVTVEKPIADNAFPFWDGDLNGIPDGADLRPLPDDFTTSSTNTFPYTLPIGATTIPNNTLIWVPIVVWDGLREVFEVRN